MSDEFQQFQVVGRTLMGLADSCRADDERMRQANERPEDLLREYGIDLPEDAQVNVVLNTPDTFHVVLPPDPNQHLADESLMSVSGGGKTVGTSGTVACAGTLPSCVSSVGSASSLGTIRDSL